MTAPRFAPLLISLALFGCGGQTPPAAPARFEQPNAVDFVCLDADNVVPLADCATTTDTRTLHALVTQHARGEVAAVDIDAHKVLDSRRDIPGYTFVPVGSLPVAIAVPKVHPARAYVADFGSADVRVLETRALVAPTTMALGEDPNLQVVPLRADGMAVSPTHMLLAPDESGLLVSAPEQGRVLWLPICRQSSGACSDGMIDTTHIVAIDLQGSVDRIGPPPAAPVADSYEKLCGYERATPPPAAPITPSVDALAPAPRPSGMAVDACRPGQKGCTNRILVADEALPLIHVLDLDALEMGADPAAVIAAPLVAGVSTRAVAVTPAVPKTVDGSGETKYVYAIDAADGSVLVMENGRVLDLDPPPAPRPDRIDFTPLHGVGAPSALSLVVMTPQFNPDIAAAQWVSPNESASVDPLACTDEDHSTEDPARLRGVFLAVAMSDGTIRIVDVHDMELHSDVLRNAQGKPIDGDGKVVPESNAAIGSCRACPDNPIPVLIRNHERLALSFQTEDTTAPVLTPKVGALAFGSGSVAFNVQVNGASGTPDAPGLQCLACSAGYTQVFPEAADQSAAGDQGGCSGDTPALLCSVEDPWILSEQTWIATYEGEIPHARGAGATFVPPDPARDRPAPELAAPGTDFCAAGVLGNDVIADAFADQTCDAAGTAQGDQVVITSRIPSDDELDQLGLDKDQIKQCAMARQALSDDDTRSVAFEIRRAYRNRLVISQSLIDPLPGGVRTYTDLQRCLGGAPMSFGVRTRGSFAVVGVDSGFQHRVTVGASERCVVDTAANPLLRGRARPGCTFRNQFIEWAPRKPGADDPIQTITAGVQLQSEVYTPATKLIVDASFLGFGSATVVPTDLRYNPVDNQLYLVDISDRGLLPIPLDPLQTSISTSAMFN